MSTIHLDQLETISKQLGDILAALQNLGTPFQAPTMAPQEAPEAPEAQTPETTEPEAEQPAEVKEQAPAITHTDMVRRVAQMTASNDVMKAKVRAVVKEYAEKVSGIPEDKLSEVWERLNELEG